MVDRTDIGHLLGAARSLSSLHHAARIVLRHGADRLRLQAWHAAGDGQCACRSSALLAAAAQRAHPDVDAVVELIEDNGRVTGVKLQSNSSTQLVSARRGVVLATGGLSRNPQLRQQLLPKISAYSPVAESATGDGVALGTEGRRASRRQPRQQRLLDPGLGAQPAGRQHGRLPASRPRPGQARRHRRRCQGQALRQRGHQLSCLRRGHAGGRRQPLPSDLRRHLHRQVRPRHGAPAPDEPAQGHRRRLRDAGINAGGTRRGAADRRKGVGRNRRPPQRLCRHRRRSRFRQGQRRLSAQPGRCRAHAQSLHRPDRDAAVLCGASSTPASSAPAPAS